MEDINETPSPLLGPQQSSRCAVVQWMASSLGSVLPKELQYLNGFISDASALLGKIVCSSSPTVEIGTLAIEPR